MFRHPGRRFLWVYALLLLIAAVGYARFDTYMMDGDGTAFMDIAQDLNSHRAALAINGYWNPGYPAVLAAAERLAHPSLWRELAVVRYANVLIFALAMAACVFFTASLARVRAHTAPGRAFAVTDTALHLLGLGLLTLSLGRELPVAAPRADTLLFVLLMAAAGCALRITLSRRPLPLFALLGLALGCAYLTKSFAFLPSLALLFAVLVYSVRQPSARRTTMVAGSLLACVLFAATAGPYILAISHQLGHFTTGESARLNYAFFIDMTPRWHEWFHHDLGHAGGTFLHPESPLATEPPVFSYAAHPFGTFPLWFDPAWWTLGIKPHVWLKGHLYRLLRNVVVFFRYLLGRPEIFVLLGVMVACGARLFGAARRRTEGRSAWNASLYLLAPLVWGALMLAIYFPIDLQDRYLTAPLFLVVLPLFALLHTRETEAKTPSATTASILNALVVLFALTSLVQAATYLADKRRHIPPAEQRHAGFDPQMFTAAAALDQLGVHPGSRLACMGDLACYTDHYWARLAGGQILAEVETPGEANPLTVWNAARDKDALLAPLQRLGIQYIVSLFPNSATKPEGWVQLGGSNFFAYPVQHPVSASEAARIAAFSPVP